MKWLNAKKLEDKLEYKRNTVLAKREVRRIQRLNELHCTNSFGANTEHWTPNTSHVTAVPVLTSLLFGYNLPHAHAFPLQLTEQ